ncbi:MAG: OmpA family protein [Cyclobacteriaceae bacterium]|nr:OmpA family protein [Cyclobacteriaceae bacterium]UYN85984.1 MAG: OmpA family protein [Cyclobacteriaceae bacterium]
MKYFLLVLLLAGIFCSTPEANGQTTELKPGYYVTVAAYAKAREDLAQKFTNNLASKGHTARYGFNTQKNLYFVYLSYFTELKPALVEMQKVREKGEFTDAWVRVVSGEIDMASTTLINALKPDEKPTQPVVKPEEKTIPTISKEAAPKEVAVEEEITENPPIVQHNPMTLGNTEVFISLFNATNNRVVDGEVQVIDTERNRLMTTVKGNEYLILPDPKSKSGQLTLIGEVFGYRKLQHEINYPLPLADTVKPYVELMGTTLAIKFDMVRYHKGDKTTLYNVYFFNDAAIMRPESKYELTSLLQMMQENRNYKIRLHGHTNGNYHGKILGLGPDKNFFSMEGAVQQTGSSKELSAQRAETIKEYLVANGISADRIEIKAWGGKRPIYDKHSANAKKNVRVEVEILQE